MSLNLRGTPVAVIVFKLAIIFLFFFCVSYRNDRMDSLESRYKSHEAPDAFTVSSRYEVPSAMRRDLKMLCQQRKKKTSHLNAAPAMETHLS